MTELRTAIVGSGFVARGPCRRGARFRRTRSSPCRAGREPGAEQLAAEIGAAAFDSLEDALASGSTSLHVCTPNALHVEQALLATRARSARRLRKAARARARTKAGACSTRSSRAAGLEPSAYHVRGYPLVEHMRATVADGGLGELRVVHGRYICDDALLVSARLAAAPRELRPDLRDRGPRRTLVRSRRARDGHAHHRSARRLPHLRSGRRPRGSRCAVASLRQRCHRSRGVQRARPGRKNQLLFELEGSSGGFTWDQEISERAAPPACRRSRRRSSSRIPERTPGGPQSSRATRPGTQRATAMPSGRSCRRRRTLAMDGRGARPVSRLSRTGTEACRSSKRRCAAPRTAAGSRRSARAWPPRGAARDAARGE